MKTNKFPPGWDEQRVRDVIDYYEHQSDKEAAAEHAAALENPTATLMEVPTKLVPVFRELIARHQQEQRGRR